MVQDSINFYFRQVQTECTAGQVPATDVPCAN